MSTIKVDNLQTTGGAGLYPARAWVNFNGTGTIAIRDDEGVSSLTDHTTGQYSANLASATTNANGSAVASHSGSDTVVDFHIIGARQTTTTAMRMGTFQSNFIDRIHNSMVLVHR